ncbi:probable 2-oxoglutarate-dependent dioxygenase AOP1.2 [Vitis riparia]|uniref:probable 2-oxoglutarate-dependent dioxygenase AOP1.2 n=1 Tax=Vitis riparia TaxID=96939 RepID=UPI00155ABAF4|nr:probable 2-oxoglutarate-dependent dioxygenase AOP1.2 [Vitis riparia]
MSRIVGLETLRKIPIVDFSKENLKPSTDSWFPACNNVRHALEEYGCFMAVYDQVPLGVYNTVFGAMRELFDLPIEIKKQNIIDKPYQGYTSESPVDPLHQGMGIDNAKVMWPAGNEHFCESVHCYSKLLSELEQTVMRMIDSVRFHGLVSRCHLRDFYYFYSSANVYASFSFGSSNV